MLRTLIYFRLSLSLVLVQACIFSSTTFAEQSSVKIGVSFSIPPWVITDDNSGIELDILREALAFSEIAVLPVYMPNSRIFEMYNNGLVDGMINVKDGMVDHGYFSQPVVTFENVAISLQKKGFDRDIPLSFLKDKSVVGFQKASQYLGQDFSALIGANEHYQEYSKQSVQLNLLFLRDADFIILEKNIFQYYLHEAIVDFSRNQETLRAAAFKEPVTFHPLFPKNDYKFVFRDSKIRDAFDRGLASLRDSGKYQGILEKYTQSIKR